MIPIEKAKDLYNIFYNTGVHNNSVNVRHEIAKEHSKKCVQEILKSFDGFMDARKNLRHELEIEAERYWLSVKAEIEKL